jgi:hypothetical protein
MGGPGSGRRYRASAAACTDQYRQLDVRRWHREGFLKTGKVFAWQWACGGDKPASIDVNVGVDNVILSYRHRRNGEDWQSMEYAVRLAWTICNFGGRRPWFLCPVQGCGRRVAILYGGAVFACRCCYRLMYRTQRESAVDRAIRRADRIRSRLDWDAGILNDVGGKPKWMRMSTFDRLKHEHQKNVLNSLVGIVTRLGIDLDAI